MIAGPDGDDGFKGLKGFPGRDGFDGLKGYRGEMGRNGADGLPGTPGDTLKGMSFVSLSAQTSNRGTPLTPPIWSLSFLRATSKVETVRFLFRPHTYPNSDKWSNVP